MKAVQFSAKVKNGIIKVPKTDPEPKDNEVKVILMWEEKNGKNFDTKKITTLLFTIKKKKIFDKVKDPSKWQKQLRDE